MKKWTMDTPTARALAMLGATAQKAIATLMESGGEPEIRLGPYECAEGHGGDAS